MRRVELALFLGGIDRKFFQKVFVYATDQVFFFAKLLVADFVDFINQLFDVVCGKVACGKGALHKAAFQLLEACRNAVKCIVQCYIQLGSRRIDNGRPSCLRRQIVGAIRKGGIVKERRTDIFIVRVKSLIQQGLAELLHTVLIFFTDETQKHQRQHHIALFKERAGVACCTQNISALKEDRIQVDGILCLFLHHFVFLHLFFAYICLVAAAGGSKSLRSFL